MQFTITDGLRLIENTSVNNLQNISRKQFIINAASDQHGPDKTAHTRAGSSRALWYLLVYVMLFIAQPMRLILYPPF